MGFVGNTQGIGATNLRNNRMQRFMPIDFTLFSPFPTFTNLEINIINNIKRKLQILE